jgi:hypothetical protein
MKRSRVALAVVVLVALLVAPSAQANERRQNYTYTTWLRSLNNPACWYRDEGCSDWDYWTSNWVYYGTVGGQVLQGFENNSVIRGLKWTPPSSYQWTVYPGDYSMGGYLKANILWWSGGDTYIVNTEAYHP